MTHARRPLFIAAAATAGLLLSGCGSATTGSATPATTESTSTSEEASTSAKETSTSAKETSTAPVAAGGDVTAPGTKLKVGARAVIPFASGDKKGTIAVTLTAIEAGAKADLAKFGDKAKHISPFYLRVQIENLSGGDLAFTSISLRGLGADGKSTGVIITGDTANCDSTSAPKTFSTAGAKYETCVLQGAREGAAVAAAAYANGEGYDKSPITWSK